MIYVFALLSFGVTAYYFLRRRKLRLLNLLYPHDVVYFSQNYSIYSKNLGGGRVFGVINNSAPALRSSFIFESSSLDTALAFVKRCEDLNKVV